MNIDEFRELVFMHIKSKDPNRYNAGITPAVFQQYAEKMIDLGVIDNPDVCDSIRADHDKKLKENEVYDTLQTKKEESVDWDF